MPSSRGIKLRRRSARLLLAASAAALSPRIFADTLLYVAPGGNWSTASNWSEQYVPMTGDTTNLLNTGSNNTIITFDNAAPVVNLNANIIDYTGTDGGSVTFSQSVNSFSTTVEYIGLNGTGLMNLTGGTHTISGAGSNALYVGYNSGSSGTVNMSGGSTSLIATDSVYVGYSGLGIFNQSGGSHTLGGYLVLGGEPTGTAVAGTGTYNLSGGSITVNTLYAGLTGNGNLAQTGGSLTAGGLTSGYLPGSSGTVSLGGSGFMDVTGAMTIGDQGNGTFIQNGGFDLSNGFIVGNSAGGFGTMILSGGTMWSEGVTVLGSRGNATILQNGGTYNQYENLFLAVAGGGVANYSLSNGGTLHVVSSVVNGNTYFGGEYIGYQGPAVFNQSGGSHIVDVYFYLGAQPGGSGTYNLSGGALLCPAQNIGGGGTANDIFNQTGGSNIANSYVALGWLGGTRGTYNLNGGSLNVGSGIYDGYKGTGSFTQTGGSATSSLLYLGYSPFSSGFYTLTGGNLTVSSAENIGYQSTGIFTQTGGTHTVAGTATITLSSLSGGVGTYNLQGGTLTAGPMVNNGAFNLTGGSAGLTALSGAGSTSISGSSGQTILALNSFSQQRLAIGSNGKLAVISSILQATNTAATLSITGSGVLDLANSSLITSSSPSTIQQYLANGYNNGAWNGTGGISSSNAAADYTSKGANAMRALGYTSGTSSIGAGLGLATNQTMVKYTIYGDSNLDGIVSILDFGALSVNFGHTGVGWEEGDYNYDGVVNILDFGKLSANFGHSATATVAMGGASVNTLTGGSSAKASASASTVKPAATPAGSGVSVVVNTTTGDVQLSFNNIQSRGYEIDSPSGEMNTFDQFDTPPGPAMLLSDGNIPANDNRGNKYWIVLSSDGDPTRLAEGLNTGYHFSTLPTINQTFDLGDIFVGPSGTNVPDLSVLYVDGSGDGFQQVVQYVGVPEPTTLGLLGLAAAGLVSRRRKKI